MDVAPAFGSSIPGRSLQVVRKVNMGWDSDTPMPEELLSPHENLDNDDELLLLEKPAKRRSARHRQRRHASPDEPIDGTRQHNGQ